MAVTIDNELITFYDKLSGSIGSVSSTVSSLNTKLSDLKTTNSTLSSEISANYQGTGKDSAISSIFSINSAVEAINTSFTEGPLKVISESNDLISKIIELKTLKEEIDNLEKDKDSLGGKWTYTEGGSKTQSEVNSHNNQITQTEEQISAKEASIDGTIASINGVSLATVSSTTTSTGTESTGTDPLQTDTGTNSIDTSATTSADIAAKKKQFLGDVDDPNNYEAVHPRFSAIRKEMTLFDNTTGEILTDRSTITMKPGET